MSKAISEVFDVEPYSKETPLAPIPEEGQEVADDAKYAADNIRQLIEIGLEAVKEAANVASDSESPRAYEVVSTMIKGLADMNLQLMSVHEKKKSLRDAVSGKLDNPQVGNVTNNAIFVGTTKELNEIILKRISGNGEQT